MVAPQDRVIHFLVVFDHVAERAAQEVETFDDPAVASAAYEAAEQCFADDPGIEVVLLGSDSLETVRFTHPNYFGRPSGLSDMFDRVLAG